MQYIELMITKYSQQYPHSYKQKGIEIYRISYGQILAILLCYMKMGWFFSFPKLSLKSKRLQTLLIAPLKTTYILLRPGVKKNEKSTFIPSNVLYNKERKKRDMDSNLSYNNKIYFIKHFIKRQLHHKAQYFETDKADLKNNVFIASYLTSGISLSYLRSSG